ncbi:MAG: DJ-1/PfpI family protein [Muribaculaceae bacterium]|nr:DJ-1/PfpI family protein [Muribaculaceae bacterium]
MNYVFLAPGFEEIEAVTPIDVLRRAGLEVTVVSIVPGEKAVTGANGVTYVADVCIDGMNAADADWLILPGGLPGSTNLYECAPLADMLRAHMAKGGHTAAICAAPAVVLGQLGLLRGRRATCYPGCENMCEGAEMIASPVVADGNLITGWGPSAALPWAYAIVDAAAGRDTADALREGMLFNRTFSKQA